MTKKTIFTRIINGDVPADKIYEDDKCICVRDINPQAPTHLLLIPRKPIPRIIDAVEEDKVLLGHLLLKVKYIAKKIGVDDAFRLIINNGADAGQTVFHLHIHILAGKPLLEDML